MKSRINKYQATVLFAALVCVACFFITAAGASEKRTPLKIEGKNTLLLRVLSRPFSNIYKEAIEQSGTVEENVAAFQPFFVYRKKAGNDFGEQGWYEVGLDDKGNVKGWMQAKDVVEWKQTLCLAYAHPGDSRQVLMFDFKDSKDGENGIKQYLSMPEDKRKVEVSKLYETIESGEIPSNFPVKSISPKMAVDISKEFYLLPILSHEPIDIDGREGRILQIAAVTKADAKARERSDIRTNQDYLEEANKTSEEALAKKVEDLAVDIVWVMDTTSSMGPYITQTVKVAGDVSQAVLKEKELSGKIKFGIWGYRDNKEQNPGIGYTTNNYTPELQNIDQFVSTLEGVKATTVGSKGYDEDVFSGVDDAIKLTKWTPNALRLIVLVGDAPSHEADHESNTSGLDENRLRELATSGKFSILSLHIKDVNPKAQIYHDLTEEQFRILSHNKGVKDKGEEVASYFDVASDNSADFELRTHEIASTVIGMLKDIETIIPPQNKQGGYELEHELDLGELEPEEQVAESGTIANKDLEQAALPATTNETESNSETLIKATLKAALVEWIGTQAKAQAPRDIVAWVTDKDMIEPSNTSLEVRVLLDKSQLAKLGETLDYIIEAGNKGDIRGDDFFGALQAAAAATVRDPDKIGSAESLSQAGIIPEFLIDLPYTSTIMDMDKEYWNSKGADGIAEDLTVLGTKIEYYNSMLADHAGWIQLNSGDDAGESVYPVPLSELP